MSRARPHQPGAGSTGPAAGQSPAARQSPAAAHTGPPLRTSALASRVLAVFLGGIAGTLLRASLMIAFAEGTALVIANTAACFALALVYEVLPAAGRRPLLRLGLGTGLAGALSTTSALAVHSVLEGSYLYPLATLAAGILAAVAGSAVGRAAEVRS